MGDSEIFKKELLTCKALVEASTDCIKFFQDGNCVYTNKASIKEHNGRLHSVNKWIASIVPEHKTSVRKALANAYKGISSNILIQHLPGKSKSKWCSCSFVPVKANGIVGVNAVSRDVTQMIEKEQLQDILSRFPEETPNPVWRVDRKGKILYANLPAQAFIKLPEELVSGINATFKTGKPKKVQSGVGKKTYQFSISYIKGRDYANVYGMDITEIRQAQEALRKGKELVEKQVQQRTEELAQKVKELEIFRDSVISAELELKRLEEENMRLTERLATRNNK